MTRTKRPNRPQERAVGALAYTNRKGATYYLHEGKTKTGKVRLFCARSVGEGALAELPTGWEISESINGVVSVRRPRKEGAGIPIEHLARVQAELRRHEHLRHHVALVERDAIVIYQPDVDFTDLRLLAASLAMRPGGADAFVADRIAKANFSPVFRLAREHSSYVAHRMTYRGGGGWSYPLASGPLDGLLRELVPKVGTDAFFELM